MAARGFKPGEPGIDHFPVDVLSTGENPEQNKALSEGVALDHVQPSKNRSK